MQALQDSNVTVT